MFLKFCESKGVDKIYRVPENSQHQRVVKVLNRTIQNCFTSAKHHKSKKYNLEESYNNFLIY